MKKENSDDLIISSQNFEEYVMLFKDFLHNTEKILNNNGVRINSLLKEEILNDALTDSFILYNEKELEISDFISFHQWICKTAFHKFMNTYKSYKKVVFCEISEIEKLPDDFIYEPHYEYTDTEFKEYLSHHCSVEELELLKKHWIEGYSLKEISVELNISVSAVQQRHKRLLDRLRENLHCP